MSSVYVVLTALCKFNCLRTPVNLVYLTLTQRWENYFARFVAYSYRTLVGRQLQSERALAAD